MFYYSFIFIALFFYWPLVNSFENSNDCENSPIQSIFLYDITTPNVTDFTNLQNKLIETIRHIETVAFNRQKKYSVAAFHRLPVILTNLKASHAADANKIIKQIEFLKPRRHMETSPARALETAADQITKGPEKAAKNIVFLAHDGQSTDLIAETMEAISHLENLHATIFVISGSEEPNKLALIGYTKERRRLYLKPSDRANFFKALDKALGVCKIKAFRQVPSAKLPATTNFATDSSSTTPKTQTRLLSNSEKEKLGKVQAPKLEHQIQPKVFGLRTIEAAENRQKKLSKKFSTDMPCEAKKIDLMLLIDTSSSVFNAFHDELQLAQDLINGLNSNAFDEAVQIGLIQFASDASIILPIERGHQRKEIIKKIRQIAFTGRNTRIADAIDRALSELITQKRENATQVLVLISDGHGQEFWHRVQETGKRLHNSGAEIFAATTSRDYNFPELLIYAGDESRIFVGTKHTNFVPFISGFINKCITNETESGTINKLLELNGEQKGNLTNDKIVNDTLETTTDSEPTNTTLNIANENKETADHSEETIKSSSKEHIDEVSDSKNSLLKTIVEKIKASDSIEKFEQKKNIAEPSSQEEPKEAEEITDDKKAELNEKPDRKILVETEDKSHKEAEKESSSNSKEESIEIDTLDQHGPLKEPAKSTIKLVHQVLKTEHNSTENVDRLIKPDKENKDKDESKEDSKSKEIEEKSDEKTDESNSSKTTTIEPIQDNLQQNQDKSNENEDKTLEEKSTTKDDTKLSILPVIDLESDNNLSGKNNSTATNTKLKDKDTTTTINPEAEVEIKEDEKAAKNDSRIKESIDASKLVTPNIKEMVHEAIQKAEIMEKFLSQQNIVPETIPCQTDIVFIIDRAQKPSFVFEHQIQLIKDLVLKIMPEEVDNKKIRLSAVTFSQKPHLLVSLDSNHTRNGFLEAMEHVTPSEEKSSLSQAIRRAVIEIMLNRRDSARLITILVTDGINNDTIEELEKSISDLTIFRKSDAYVVSSNPEYNFSVLQALTGNKWKVYVDARVRKFVNELGHSLKVCEIPAEETKSTVFVEDGEHEPTSDVEKVEHLQIAGKAVQALGNCSHDLLDIVIILDLSTSVSDDFDEQKLVASHLLKQAPESDYARRIRVGLITFSSGAQLAIPLNTARTRDDLLYAFDRIEHTGGQTSVVSGILLAVSEIERHHRPGARLILILVSDGNSRDEWPRVMEAGSELNRVVPERYAVTLSPDSNERELSVYAGDEKRVFNQNTVQRFLFDSRFFFVCNQKNSSSQTEKNDKEDIKKIGNKTDESFNTTIGDENNVLSGRPPKSEETSSSHEEARTGKKDDRISGRPPKSEETSSSHEEARTGKKNDRISGRPLKSEETSSSHEESPTGKKSNRTDEETIKAADQPFQDSAEKFNEKIVESKINKHIEPKIANQTTTVEITNRTSTPPNFEGTRPVISFLSDECKVDLMFIIDTSQSVSGEFQKQLQFAVDLVKRLPNEDFEHRVQVAAVSFNSKARLEFPFGKLLIKEDVLDALIKLKHSGGSTSAASGVALAIEEMQRARRSDARLMVVLVSDGNSQDYWDRVIFESNRLREIKADVYAVTVSKEYFFRELELYAGSKWLVYIDARIRQFLDEAEMSLVQCVNPTIPSSDEQQTTSILSTTTSTAKEVSTSTTAIEKQTTLSTTEKQTTLSTTAALSTSASTPSTITIEIATPSTSLPNQTQDCQHDIIDLMFILDTSTSIEKDFYAEKNFALDLIKVLPESDFKNRIRVGMSKFYGTAKLQFGLLEERSRNDILYDIERVEHTGGQTSLVRGTEIALEEIKKNKRPNSRLVTIIISDGNSQDDWNQIQITSKKLRETGSEIYAVTLSDKYYFDELKEYTGNEKHIYIDDKIDKFIQEVGKSVASCPGKWIDHVTMAPSIQASATPTTKSIQLATPRGNIIIAKSEDDNKNPRFWIEFARHDSNPIQVTDSKSLEFEKISRKCKVDKMDLIIILDASSSRESVFEHQRELALSLIERLPISKDDTHVAIGINSFTNTPTLRQHLGLGRDKEMVRHAIEGIEYRGGSTLTSKAIELAVEDLGRGKRPDAKQVIVLMNDGMSQDPWDVVVSASKKLAASGAERFGVALGKDIDLREIRLYIENEDRIYRDGETERFLSDVVSLLTKGSKDCEMPEKTDIEEPGFSFSEDACQKPKLDVVILFDNSDNTPDLTDPRIIQDRYLLLDVLGSLPTGDDVKVAIYSFTENPQLEHRFSDAQDRDSLFERIESIKPKHGNPSYAKAVHQGLNYYNQNRRPDARGILLIAGDGQSNDSSEDRSLASNTIRKTSGLTCYAVDTSKDVDVQTLSSFTGSQDRVYNYDRNADFAKELMNLANAGKAEKCERIENQETISPAIDEAKAQTYSTSIPFQRQRDIAVASAESKEMNILRINNVIGQRPISGKHFDITKLITSSTEAISTRSPRRLTTASLKIANQLHLTSRPTGNAHLLNKTKETGTTNRHSNERFIPTKSALRLFNTFKTSTTTAKSLVSKFENNKRSTIIKPLFTTQRPKSLRTNDPNLTVTRSTRSINVNSQTTKSPTTSLNRLAINDFNKQTNRFVPGCLLDIILIIDASGSVEETFIREKDIAKNIIGQLRIGPNNARVALIKFASKDKVRTVHPFNMTQTSQSILHSLDTLNVSSGITATGSALQQAVLEYENGGRKGIAEPLAIIFTDGFASKEISNEAILLRKYIPQIFAVAINHQYPISRIGLEKITNDPKRVFTDSNINEFYAILRNHFRSC